MASFSESEVASALSRAATKLGYSTLLPQQERVVRAFVQGRDVFVSLPTGSGKSLCYCLLPLLFDELYGSQRKSMVVVVRALLHICLLELCSLFLWLSVAAHVQRKEEIAHETHSAHTSLTRECPDVFFLAFPPPTSHLRMRARRKITSRSLSPQTLRRPAFRLRSHCVVRCLPGAPCVVRCLPNTLLTCQDVPGSHSAFLCRVKGHTLTSCARRRGSLGTRLTQLPQRQRKCDKLCANSCCGL